MGQIFDQHGNLVGSEFRINTATNINQEAHSNGVFARALNADDSAAGAEFQVNTYEINSQQRPDVSSLSGGGFVVNWEEYDRQGGDEMGVFAQIYDGMGNTQESEFQVNSFTTGN